MNRITMTTGLIAGAMALGLATTAPAWVAHAEPADETPRPINLAICLDTSGSMDGLIDAARQTIWDVVNDLALAEPTPDLSVALVTFGNNGHAADDGWVRVQTDFTTDLDQVSRLLFDLRTNGGEEYVGRVVDRATNGLAWHASDDALRITIVAGNESADQDPKVSFRDACRAAIGRDIMVNSIYCGPPTDELAPAWREVATLSDGHFASIDQDQGTIIIATPFDDELTELSGKVNTTYVSFNQSGRAAQTVQSEQDWNASETNQAAAASRAQTKGCSTVYRCNWDLVDAVAQDSVKLAEIEDEELPEEMRGLSLQEKLAYLDSKAAERARIQSKITSLGKERELYIAQEITRRNIDASKSFGHVIRSAVRSQASSRGFRFEELATATPTAGDAAATPEPSDEG